MTVPQMLIAACERHADRPAATNLDHTISYGDVNRLSDDLAAFLRALDGSAPVPSFR